MFAHLLGNELRATTALQEAVALHEAGGDPTGLARLLVLRGVMAVDRGRYEDARANLSEALALLRSLNEPVWTANALDQLGIAAYGLGDFVAAVAFAEEALAVQRAVGDRWGMANSLNLLGHVHCEQGRYVEAATAHAESLTLRWDQGSREDVARSLAGLAAVAVASGNAERAARLFGAVDGLCAELGFAFGMPERAHYEAAIAAARARLGEPKFTATHAAGGRLPLADAVVAAAAAAVPAPPVLPPHPPDPTDLRTDGADGAGLTARELEVLRLLAAGGSNRQIGAALSISSRTVGVHVGNLLAKLGVDSRAAAVAKGYQRGLISPATMA